MDPNEKKSKALGLIEQAEAIEAAATTMDRDTTEDEANKIDGLYAEAKTLNAEAEEQEAAEAEAAEIKADRESLKSSLTAIPGRKIKPITGHQRPGPEPKTEFESFGEFLYAATRRTPSDPRLNYVDLDAASDHTVGDSERGGFMVPEQHRDELLRSDTQSSIIRPRARVIPAGSPPDAAITFPALDQASVNLYGGVEMEWIGEGETKPQTDTKFREIKLEPKELAGHIAVTDKLLRNWAAASSLLSSLMRDALMAAEDTAFLLGNGIGKPLGLVPSGAAYDVARATSSTIKYADLVAMRQRLRGTSAVWIATPAAWGELATMEDTAGHLIWQPNASAGSPGTIMGLPVAFNERSPALGTKGDLVLANLSEYLIKDGSGPFVSTGWINDDFTKNKTRIKIFTNVDGQPWLTAPIKLENNFEVSPFVVLDDAA